MTNYFGGTCRSYWHAAAIVVLLGLRCLRAVVSLAGAREAGRKARKPAKSLGIVRDLSAIAGILKHSI